MRASSLIKTPLIFAALATLAPAEPAMAQFVPYSRYGYGYGWGRLPSSLPSADAVLADKGKDRRQALAEVSRQQRDRNSFLMSQAKSNSSWIAKNNASVDQFRLQQAQRQGSQFSAGSRPLPAAPRMTTPAPSRPLPTLPLPTQTRKPSSSRVSGDTRWPTLLNGARFAETRLKLDKHLAADEASQVGLTTAEYEEIVAEATRMKEILRRIAVEINAAEYLAVEKFLNDLISKYQSKANPTQ